MKILHTSDWHIGRMIFDFPMLDDQQFFINQLYELIEYEKPDALIIAGDLYNRHVPSTDAIKFLDDVFYHVITVLKTPIFCIAGNHDSGQRLAFASRLYEQNGLFIEGEPSKTIRKITLNDEFGEVNFFLLPYIQPGDVRPFFPDDEVKTYDDAYRVLLDYNRKFVDFSQRNILIAHGFFSPISDDKDLSVITSDSEISVGGTDIVSTIRLKGFDYVALGHLHAPQKLGSDFIRYSGSPLKYSISEANHTKSVTIIDIKSKGNISISTKEILYKKDVRIIKGSFEQLISPQNGVDTKDLDYVFAEIEDKKMILHAMEKLRILYPNILGLKFKAFENSDNDIIIGGNHKEKLPISTLFWEFAKTVNDIEPTKESKKIMDKLFDEVGKEAL